MKTVGTGLLPRQQPVSASPATESMPAAEAFAKALESMYAADAARRAPLKPVEQLPLVPELPPLPPTCNPTSPSERESRLVGTVATTASPTPKRKRPTTALAAIPSRRRRKHIVTDRSAVLGWLFEHEDLVDAFLGACPYNAALTMRAVSIAFHDSPGVCRGAHGDRMKRRMLQWSDPRVARRVLKIEQQVNLGGVQSCWANIGDPLIGALVRHCADGCGESGYTRPMAFNDLGLHLHRARHLRAELGRLGGDDLDRGTVDAIERAYAALPNRERRPVPAQHDRMIYLDPVMTHITVWLEKQLGVPASPPVKLPLLCWGGSAHLALCW